jgi:hypothetical protein
MSDDGHAAAHDEHEGNQLGAIGSQEAVTVVALSVTFGILMLMCLVLGMSRIL